MSTIDDGGPAFPVSTAQANDGEYGHQSGHSTWQFPGMTLRDHFAGQALQGASANPRIEELFQKHGEPGQVLADWIAPGCYVMADAMLKARTA